MNGLFTLLHFFAWMTMAIGVLHTWKDWRNLLVYEVILSGIMAIVAIMQKLNPNLLLFPAGPRVGGLVDNPIYMAAYQIFNFFFLALLFWKMPEKTWRAFFVFIFALDIIAFVLASSRGALVGLAAGIVCFVLYVGILSKDKRLRMTVLGGLAVLVLAYGGLFLVRDNPTVAASPLGRLVNFTGGVDTRFIAWQIAWDGFLERPLTGWGLDDFHILFNLKYNPISLRYGSYETWFDRAHNTVLDTLSMTGIIGFLTYMSIFVAISIVTIRAYRKKWIDLPIAAILFSLPIAYFVQNLFVFDHPAGFSMSYLLYALVIAATQGEFVGEMQKVETKKDEEPINVPWTAFVIVQLLMVLLVWRTSVLPFRASQLSIIANSVMGVDPQLGFVYAKQASEIPTMYLDEQTFLLSRNLITLAGNGTLQKIPNWQEMYALTKKLSEEEISRHPMNTHPNYIYARLAQEMLPLMPSEAAVSEKYYQAAIATSPKRQQLFYGLARLYLQTGNLEPAITVFRTIVNLDTEYGEGYWNLGLTLYYDKHAFQEGAEMMKKSQTVQYRYRFLNPRELVALTEAYAFLNDDDSLSYLVNGIDDPEKFLQANADVYGQMAVILHVKGKDALRDILLQKAMKIDPKTVDSYNSVLKQSQTPPPAPASQATSTSQTSVTSTQPTVQQPASSGPRR